MFRLFIMIMLLLMSPQLAASSLSLQEEIEEFTLDNGFKVLLVSRPGQPMVAAGWVAHVGSANEKPGITGMSHLFEHMMFKGSSRIGIKDFKKDFEIRKKLDAVKAKIALEERKYRQKVRQGAASSVLDEDLQTDKMRNLQAEFKQLVAEQRENMIKDEFDQIYTKAGATSMNAFTNTDMTVYFIKVPKNKLELWFWMESERLADPIFREFYSERDVVFEERRLRIESTPTGSYDEVFDSLFWRGHAYAWPIVGWPSDIAAITREQAEKYYDTYYSPNNITLALVGDFDKTQVKTWFDRYFSRIESTIKEVPDVITTSTEQKGEVLYKAQVEAQSQVELRFKTVAFGAKDQAPLRLLASVLSGSTGRLYKRLVLTEKLATDVGASASTNKYGGSFSLQAYSNSDVNPQRLSKIMLDELEDIKRNGVSPYELEKAKNNFAADRFRRLRDPFFLLIQLLYFEGLRSWQDMELSNEALMKVSNDEIKAVATRYFVETNRAVKLFERKQSPLDDENELFSFSSDEQIQIRQMLEQVEKLPREQIPDFVASMERNAQHAPQKFKPLYRYVLKVLKKKHKLN